MLNAAQQNSTTTHQAWLLDDGEGNFTGAVIPMAAPLETMKQWQAALDTLFAEAVATDAHANIDGMYAITFYQDTEHSGLLISRIRHDINTGYDARIPDGTFGLVAVTTEPDSNSRIVICSLSGGVTNGSIRPNRILCAFIDATGTAEKPTLTRGEKLAIRAIGKFLLTRLDRHIESTRG